MAVSENELLEMMSSLGASPANAQAAMKRIDKSGDGSISFEEFCASVGPLYDTNVRALKRIFDMFDVRAQISIPGHSDFHLSPQSL